MKKWYSFYTSYEDFGDAVNALSGQMDISSLKLQQVAAEIQETASEEKLQQVVAEIPFPAIFGFIPWGHHIEIITKCKDLHEALFYVKRTVNRLYSGHCVPVVHVRNDSDHGVPLEKPDPAVAVTENGCKNKKKACGMNRDTGFRRFFFSGILLSAIINMTCRCHVTCATIYTECEIL